MRNVVGIHRAGLVRLLLLLFGGCAGMSAPAWGRDPGPLDVRGRDAAMSGPRRAPARPPRERGPVPAPLSFDAVHVPPAAHGRPEPRRRLYEEVEEAVDRGTGRIEDEQTYQLRRLRDDRDERLGRIERQREAERFEEEYDRRRRIEQRRERLRAIERERAAADRIAPPRPQRPPTAIEQTPTPGGSPLARFVAEQEALLDAARERYQRGLGEAEAERDAAVDAAPSREAAAQARRRFDERRSELTRQYQQYRRGILGQP